MIRIIDYEMGNLRSIYNAFLTLRYDVGITREPKDLIDAELIVLPGVGAFEEGMEKLNRLGMLDVLNEEVITKGKPYLGICLGMQFLATNSLEFGNTPGFDWIPGVVEKIVPEEKKYKIPHMGWADVRVENSHYIFNDLGETPVFYFVHSYRLNPAPASRKYITSTCWHGTEIVSSVCRDHICGVQFHPEKSQGAGLKLLHNVVSSILKG